MMTLPKFEDPYPSADELLAQRSQLREQADEMLAATGLIGILAEHGTMEPISGSYAYNLMAYPDLDLSLISDKADKQSFARLVSRVVGMECVRKVRTADTVSFPAVHPGRPKGYWLGVEIPFKGNQWGIDCWLQKPEWMGDAIDPYAERLSAISHDQAVAILAIKHYLIHRDIYGKTIYSVDVYDDVLEHGTLSVEQFKLRHSIA